MKHLIIEFVGTYCLCLVISLCNIAACQEGYSSNGGSCLVIGLTMLVFSIFSRGYSKGFFNPYFAIFEILTGRLSVEKGVGTFLHFLLVHKLFFFF